MKKFFKALGTALIVDFCGGYVFISKFQKLIFVRPATAKQFRPKLRRIKWHSQTRKQYPSFKVIFVSQLNIVLKLNSTGRTEIKRELNNAVSSFLARLFLQKGKVTVEDIQEVTG